MGKTSKTPTPTPTPTPSSKRSRPEDSPRAIPPPGNSSIDILLSIEQRLTSVDARLNLMEILHQEFQAMRESLEFSQQQVVSLAAENKELRGSVKSLTEGMSQLCKDNKYLKETVLDLQARSMRDNLVFSGIPEKAEEDPERTVADFLTKNLKLPMETVKTITFHRVHRLGGKKPDSRRPRPIVVKFEHFKQKVLVKSRGRELRGTDFGVNDQFPREILDRRRILFPIRKRFLDEGSRAVVAVDKLFVNGQLYRDRESTPWLY